MSLTEGNIITGPPKQGRLRGRLRAGVVDSLDTFEIRWLLDAETARDLTGAALTGTITQVNGGATAAIAGTLAPDSDQVNKCGVFTWLVDADDVTTAGTYLVRFTAVISSVTYVSDPVLWSVRRNPVAA